MFGVDSVADCLISKSPCDITVLCIAVLSITETILYFRHKVLIFSKGL